MADVIVIVVVVASTDVTADVLGTTDVCVYVTVIVGEILVMSVYDVFFCTMVAVG